MHRRSLAFAAAVFALAACSSADRAPDVLASSESALARSFREVAVANGVPRELLVAIAEVEGGLAIPARREVDADAKVPAAGPLQLRHGKRNTLARGAALMGVPEIALRRDADLALEAGGRVLAELFAETHARVDDVVSWRRALEELSGYADAAHRADYANRVYRVLARGGRFVGRDGMDVGISPLPIPSGAIDDVPLSGNADYGPADWIDTPSTNKWTSGRGGNAIDTIVIHDTEGGWDASVSTLQNDPGKSAHFIVGTDGRVAQFVHESDTAWHAGNWYYNQRSIGIEHVGYYSDYQYTAAEYATSADLVKYLIGKYGVTPDRTHVIGHDQIPNGNLVPESSEPCADAPSACEKNSNYGGAGNHTDPGSWEWCTYMPMIGGECKCDDIWSLWNCNHALDGAYRCNGGVVERQVCDGPGGCEVQPIGTDDVCHVAPTPPDAGTSDAGDDAAGGETGAPDANPTDAAHGDVAMANTAGNGGCTTSRTGADATFAIGLAAVAGLALRRRR
jgi:MYXO-CTERM domain-containing protein